MNQLPEFSHIAMRAASYAAQMNDILGKHNEWWESLKNELERLFANSIKESLTSANELAKIEDNESVSDAKAKTRSFTRLIKRIFDSGMNLGNYYNDKKFFTHAKTTQLIKNLTELFLKEFNDFNLQFENIPIDVITTSGIKKDDKKTRADEKIVYTKTQANWWFRIPSILSFSKYINKYRSELSFEISESNNSFPIELFNIDSKTIFILYGEKEGYIQALLTLKNPEYFPKELSNFTYTLTFRVIETFPGWVALNDIINETGIKNLTPLNPKFFDSYEPGSFGFSFQPLTNEEENNVIPFLFELMRNDNLEKESLNFERLPVNSNAYFNQQTLAEILTDNPDVDIIDQLSFESDVNALATVISYKNVKPPLAFGLFGKWGSGKSFFMNKLKREIEINRSKNNDIFCQNVVQVSFNSWHYSDSNLWASLITKIFEELEKYAVKTNNPLEKLYENLNSVREAKHDCEIQLERIEEDKVKLTELLNEAKGKIEVENTNLNNVKKRDILQAVFEDSEVQKNIKEIKMLLPNELIKSVFDIHSKVTELRSFSDKIIESVRIAYKFRLGQMLFAFLIAFVVIMLLYNIVMEQNTAFSLSKWISIKLVFISAALSQLTLIFGPIKGKVTRVYENLKSLEETCRKLEIKKKTEQLTALESIQKDLNNQKDEVRKYEHKLIEVEEKERKIQNEIKDIISGRKLHNFIVKKSNDQKYINNLGIISWIRKDFEELDFLLKMQNEISHDQIEKLGKNFIDIEFKVDRIVLYIDDLDRCNEETVVKVLEAIHLLLAFPLFVVILGVDPRWMNNALAAKYNNFLNVDKSEPLKHFASTYDYLEKIFQIPFALKPITNTGKSKLISAQFINRQKTISFEELNKTKNLENINNEGINEFRKSEQIKNEKVNEPPKDELLNITDDEVKFMQAISFMIGESPRTINRYINIYRIIRAHSRFGFLDENELEHYQAAMVLLAYITGNSINADSFFNKISISDDDELFGNFLDSLKIKGQVLDTYVNGLLMAMRQNEIVSEIKNIKLNKFKKNLELISRFSFRDILLDQS